VTKGGSDDEDAAEVLGDPDLGVGEDRAAGSGSTAGAPADPGREAELMATLLREDGSASNVVPADRKRGFMLTELYGLLKCDLVEAVQLPNGRILVVDENGKLAGRPVNELATMLTRGVLQPHDLVVGPALICSRLEFQ
jgi:Domain of unknown function (DUF3846)